MEEQVEIMELSELSKQDILKEVVQLLNHNQIKKLTLLVKRTPLSREPKKQEFSYSIEETGITINTTRAKSSTIDRYYRSSNWGQKSLSLFQEDDEESELNSILPDSPKDLGIKLYRDGDYRQALQIFQELRDQFPRQNQQQFFKKEYRQILTFLANCQYRLKNYRQAIITYKELVDHPISQTSSCPDDKALGQLYNNLGCCYAKVGCEKLSMSAYSEALKYYSHNKNFDCSLLIANIANIYSNCQMYAVAEKYYLEAVAERKSKNPKKKDMLDQIYRQLSLSEEKLNKYNQALESVGKALEMAEQGYGNIVEILYQRARLKEKMERWAESLQDYEKIHMFYERQGIKQGLIYEKAARIHEKMGKQTQCAKYIVMALQEYKKEGNQRKVSQLSAHRYARYVLV